MSLEKSLRRLYDREINVRIQCCWDAGWYVYFQAPETHKWERKTYVVEVEKLQDVIEREIQRYDRHAKAHRQQRAVD
jgi:hypothetical protein